MTEPEQDLGDVFARPTAASVPNRSTGLGGLVPGRGPRQDPPAQAQPPRQDPPKQNPPRQDPPAQAEPPRQDPPTEQPPQGEEPQSAEEEREEGREAEAALARSKQRTTLYVSPGLHRRFDKYVRAKRGRTNTSVVLEAIAEKRATTPEIIKKSRVSATAGNELFPEDPRAIRYLGAGPVQIQIAPTYAQLQVLDSLTEEYGFEARATWIAPVLNEFLPGKKEQVPE